MKVTSELRPMARLYIALLALSALGLTIASLSVTRLPALDRAVLGLAFVVLLAAAYRFPFDFGPRTKLTLGTSLLFAVVLLFEPGAAILIAGAGRLLGYAVRRTPADEAVLNGSQTVLQAGSGSLLLASTGWSVDPLRFDTPEQLLAVLVAAIVMYLINTLSIATVIALESGASPLGVWVRSILGADAVERLSQLALGLLTAIIADVHMWALPLLLLPTLAVYRFCELHSRLQEQSRALEHLAYHDPLTGLPNRTLYYERLHRAQAPERSQALAVLFLDLDNLKLVNDRYGHHMGDQLLVAVARRLEGCLRPEDTAARLSGDEFAILLDGITDVTDATRVAERIRERIHEPFALDGQEVCITTSIGISLTCPGDASSGDLLRMADQAMYRAKNTGKARYEVA